MSDLRLTITGKGWTASAMVPQGYDPRAFAHAARSLYLEHSPERPQSDDLLAELDRPIFAMNGDDLEFYAGRVRFAVQPKQGKQPNLGRWHELTVERERDDA